MLVNTNWLSDYIVEPCPVEDLVKALAHTPIEIEAKHDLSRELSEIIVGFIREKTNLPGLDGMYVCTADVGSGETLQVVCASEHPIEVGWGVPIAKDGAKLPTGIQIKSGRFHGAYSEGMICLDSELGMLARGSGLQVFHNEVEIGRRLVDLIPVTDSILDLKAPANRPDLLSLVGIAREVAAILSLSLKLPTTKVTEGQLPTADQVSVEIVEPSLCRRYMCRLVRNVTIRKSPPWLSSRLRSAGSNPINNVVDITNFVMHEWGQPLHAFDYETLVGAKVIVRKMTPAENLELIDGTIVVGKNEPLVIADAQHPIALAGIMGGKNTQINAHTTDVLLEAAYFDPIQIKKTLGELRLDSTDASYRFARGVDPNLMLEQSLDRAAALLHEIALGTVQRKALDVYPEKIESRHYQLTPARVSSYLGKQVATATIKTSLKRLGMRCSDELTVEVPTWRVDANDAVVLIEDVARLTGYDQIPLRSPTAVLTVGQRNSLDQFRHQAMSFLACSGFLESRNLSLESPELVSQFGTGNETAIQLINSLKLDMSLLRKSLLPGLLETVARNARRESLDFRYFALDRTFFSVVDQPVETWKVAAVAGGLVCDLDWLPSKRKFDFFHAKGLAESLMETMGIGDLIFQSGNVRGFRKGEAALVFHGPDELGVIGAIDNALLLALKIQEPIFGFELNLENMWRVSAGPKYFKELARTPGITRDLALVVGRSIPFAQIKHTIIHQAGELLEEIRCTDVYEGKPIEEGYRSISIRLRFRDSQRTLSNDEVSRIVDSIVQDLEERHEATLRM